MAVVQISRIQVRRGQKNTGTGIPQLASGEFGWAIDERELYIGNGSISEGAPTVGNTKILTEFTDILGEAAKYSYKPDEITTGTAGNIVRTLQEKLDDVVSVLDFGVANDGTVQTAAIQRAIDNLYLGPDVQGLSPEGRVVLRFPAGEYQIDGPVYVPPFATLMGDGSERTIINVTGQYGFYTVNGDSTPSNPAGSELIGTPATTLANQARSITIKGMTINKTTFDGALVLQSCRDSHFEDLIIQGAWSLGDGLVNSKGIVMNSLGSGVTTNQNIFDNCTIRNFVYGVYSDYDVTHNNFNDNHIHDCYNGIAWGITTTPADDAPGQITGPSSNQVRNSTFEDIYAEAIVIREGINNVSTDNKFIACGNHGGSSATATTAIIRFGYLSSESSEARYDPRFHVGNKSENDFFERTADLTVNGSFNTGDYPPEVEGAKVVHLNTEIQTQLGTSTNNSVAIADITRTDPVVVRTTTAHNFTNGEPVLITGITGMPEVEGRTFFINIIDSDEFELFTDAGLTGSEDGTGHNPYTSGGAAVGSVRTYFLQLPADQQRGIIYVDYIYDAELNSNTVCRTGTFTIIYDKILNTMSFSESYTATGDTFTVSLVNFTANYDQANNKVEVSFTNTGFTLGSDKDNFRFTVRHVV